jgi:hypothetical protein
LKTKQNFGFIWFKKGGMYLSKYPIIKEYNEGIQNQFLYKAQTLFQLPFKITKGINGELEEPTDLVIVSDANSHVERLVFPGLRN